MAARDESIDSDSNGVNLPAMEFKEGQYELKIGRVDLAGMACQHSDLQLDPGCLGIGSFQDLLMSASAGVLPVEMNLSNPFFDSSLLTSNTPTEINCVAQPGGLDDGYNGCDETDDNDRWGLDDPLEPANGETEDAVISDDIREDQEFDSASESDFEGDGSLSSGSETDDVEVEEITIDVDVQQEIYVDAAQVGVPYRKRKRVSSADKKLNHRTPRFIGAVERALRGSSTRKTEHIFEPVVGMVFDSREEAREFYNMYSWEVGFGIKYCNSRCSGKKQSDTAQFGDGDGGYRSMQVIACQKAGHDPRTTRASKQCGCPAKIRLLLTDDGGWYISLFVKEHNHELSRTIGEKREWSSHRQLDQTTKDLIKYLWQNNVPLTKVHCIIGSMYGSTGDVPWTKRSIRSVCSQITRDQMDDDIRKTMEIFKDMRAEDPGFKFSVDLDSSSRIKTLMWCSGRSRAQYACFGDVITFDTTYCTNIYKMPFGLFVGVNSHFQTTIFAGVLMRRETTKSFQWVFKEFLRLMSLTDEQTFAEPPKTILTDQCKAMTKAIKKAMPDTYHLWCKWHVLKKIRECLGPLYTKNRRFRDELWLVFNGMLTEDEFERAWVYILSKYSLGENKFMKRVYKCRKKWAKPWSKDKFCARMSSTQRSESANYMLKCFVQRDSSMNHFVSQYNRLLLDRDKEEDREEDRTKQLTTFHRRLWAFERHALQIYTKAAFELFRQEVDRASSYIVSARVGDVFTVTHDNAAIRAQWARVHFDVEIFNGGERFVCECGLYEHFGMLCCHVVRVMLHLGVGSIPDAHIMKRWTRNARDDMPTHLESLEKDKTVNHSSTFRKRMLNLLSAELVRYGDMDMELFEIVLRHMKSGQKEVGAKLKARQEKTEPEKAESSDDLDNGDLATVSDAEAIIKNKKSARGSGNNKFGASGSSAGLSDSEILKMKGPIVKRKVGRPRFKRYRSSVDFFGKKRKSGRQSNGGGSGGKSNACGDELGSNSLGTAAADPNKKKKANRRPIKCGKCSVLGHKSSQCYVLEVTPETTSAYN